MNDGSLSKSKCIDNGSCKGKINRGRQHNIAPSSGKPVQNGSSIIRVKMVISKQELEAFLAEVSIKEKSIEHAWLQLQSKSKHVKEDYAAKICKGVWRPSLERILEINNSC